MRIMRGAISSVKIVTPFIEVFNLVNEAGIAYLF